MSDERTLEYGTSIREEFYKVLYHVLMNHGVNLRAMPGFTNQTREQQQGMKVALDNFADVIVNLAFVPSSRMGQVNPIHRPVVEELMADLQAMLDKMPSQEEPNAVKHQLQRVSDGVVFDVLGTKGVNDFPPGEGVIIRHVIGPGHPGGFGVTTDYVQKCFIAYPPQESSEPVEDGPIEASFSTVQQATTQTKRLCREQNVTVLRVNSRYLPRGKGMQTMIHLPDDASDATYSKLVAMLESAGYGSVSLHRAARFISACSKVQGMFHNA